MPENKNIRFKGGMHRREDGPVSAPYELHNAKIGKNGGVRAYREPEVMEVGGEPNTPDRPEGKKPWIRWNDQWLSRFSDPATFSDADGQPVEVAQDYLRHAGSLYVTGRESRRLSGDTQQSPHTWRVKDTATEYSPSSLVGPPRLKLIDTTECFVGPPDSADRPGFSGELSSDGREVGGGITWASGVSYIIIPVNERDEAGPWGYYSVIGDNNNSNKVSIPTITVETDNASYVEVYRTREWKNMLDFATERRPPPDLTYYYLGRFNVVDGTTVFTDDVRWEHKYPTEDEAKKNLPTDSLDRKINAWAYESVDYSADTTASNTSTSRAVLFGGIVHVGAKAAYMVGRDRVMYGAPQWPLKAPQFAMIMGDGVEKGLHAYEYETSDQGTVYGPTTLLSNYEMAYTAWQGEQAVRIWDESDSFYYDRLTVSSSGVYPISSESVGLLANGDHQPGNSIKEGPSYGSLTKKKWVTEPNVVLLSERFRPLEITFEDQFQVPEGHKVRAFTPARLAEEESLANYNFYIFTDQGVFSGQLADDDAQTYPVTTVGIEEHTVNPDDTPSYTYTLDAVTKYGTAYVGVDHRVYHLRGRQFELLDDAVPNIWYSDLSEPQFANVEYVAIYNEYSDVWSQVGGFNADKTLTPYDLAYDEQRDQIMIATLDNVWIFDFEQKGWVGNYNVEGAEGLRYIGDLDNPNTARHRAVMVHQDPGSNDEFLLLSEGGDPIEDNALVTNPIFRSPNETKIRNVVVDYDPLARNGEADLTAGSKTITVSGDSMIGSDAATIFIPDGKDPQNLTTVIDSVVDATTANLMDAPTASATAKNVRWFPPITIRQEAVGDYHTAADVNGDPIRRSEVTYKAHPRRKKFPRANGTGHVIRVEGFRSFKSMNLGVERSDI